MESFPEVAYTSFSSETMASAIKDLQNQVAELQRQVAKLRPSAGEAKHKNEIDENWWSIENYYNNILIKFSSGNESDFHEFKDCMKELGGSYNGTKKAWKFPKISADGVIKSITDSYPNKEFKDIRE